MNEDPKVNAETPETEPSEVVADELNPEEQEDVSGGAFNHVGWIEV
ncbi:MAG: hypothetical protein WBW33_37265 [Bryobacteraceae bacterium]